MYAGCSVLHLGIISGQFDTIQLLLNSQQVDKNRHDHHMSTPLHYAIQKQNWDVVNLMMYYKAVDWNAKGFGNNTPLQMLVMYQTESEEFFDIFERFLDSEKVEVNDVNRSGQSALHVAAAAKSFYAGEECMAFRVAKLLLECLRTRYDLEDEAGKTALHVVMENEYASDEIKQDFIEEYSKRHPYPLGDWVKS